MTIKEYLHLASKLRKHYEKCEKRYNNAFMAATSTPSSLGKSGVPTGKGNSNNTTESMFIREADAARDLKKASKVYREYMAQLWTDIYNLRYWEGLLIERVYITNPILDDDDPFYRVEEILNTKDRRKMQLKLNEAECHLIEIMRARGVDIDNYYRIEQKTDGQAQDNLQDGKRSGDPVD